MIIRTIRLPEARIPALAGSLLMLSVLIALQEGVVLDRHAGSHVHVANERLRMANTIAGAIVAKEQAGAPVTRCTELHGAVIAWNNALPEPWRLKEQQLSSPEGDCRHLARMIGRALYNDAGRIGISEPERRAVSANDFLTFNPWRIIPGCVHLSGTQGQTDCKIPTTGDQWLDGQLLPRAVALSRKPVTQTHVHGKQLAQGPSVRVTLVPSVQAQAQAIVRCFTGQSQCDGVLPAKMLLDPRFTSVRFRTGMLGMAVLDVATGEILAMSGSISTCTAENLRHDAIVTPGSGKHSGVLPAYAEGSNSDCPQLPDARYRWLLTTHPAIWPVAPGSTMKPIAVLAALEGNQIPATEDGRWQRILAESHDQDAPRRLAIRHAAGFEALMHRLDFSNRVDLLAGSPTRGDQTGWPIGLRTAESLPAPAMNYETAAAIRAQKAAGINVDARYGEAVIRDYLAARRLMDSAIGGGDVRFAGALGLAELFRRIELRSQGYDSAPAIHLAIEGGSAPERIGLDFAVPVHARRLTSMMSGVTSPRLRGTAAGACVLAFDGCPADGLSDLWGKTGTADATTHESSPYLKPGSLPTKLFGATFTDAQGRRLVVAAVALRGKDPRTGKLELGSNAGAEAALLLIRQLRTTVPTISERSQS